MIKTTIPSSMYEEITKYDERTFFVRFGAVEREGMVECTEMGVTVDGVATYPKLVAQLVTGRYDYDSQIAILANKNDGDPEHEAAWVEFQAWRTEAKRLAHIIFPTATSDEE